MYIYVQTPAAGRVKTIIFATIIPREAASIRVVLQLDAESKSNLKKKEIFTA